MQKKNLFNLLGLLLVLVIMGLCVALVKNFGLRVDCTEQKVYSLSAGSKALMKKLPAQVTLKFYYSRSSEKMPMFFKAYADQVDYLLRSYAMQSDGNVVLEKFDPKPDTDSEEWAQRYGIEGQQLDPFSPPVYFGLAVVCGDREEVLPVLSPNNEQSLEYDISRAITRVAWPVKPVIGVMSGDLNVLGDEPNPMMMQRGMQYNPGWFAFAQMRRDSALRKIAADTDTIPSDLTLLVLVHPKNLPEKTLYAIDQYLMNGGRLVVCVDPLSLVDMGLQRTPNMMRPPETHSSLDKLFAAWGVGFDPYRVVADMRAVTRINDDTGRAQDSPVLLSLAQDNLNPKVSLTAQLGSLLLPASGALQNNVADGLTFTPLVESSKESSSLLDAMTVAQFGFGGLPPQEPSGEKYVLAARVNGTFKSAFPNGKPKDDEDEATDDNTVVPHLASGDSMVVIFTDSDFLNDQFSVANLQTPFGVMKQPRNDNIALFFNSAEQLSGRPELIAIRSRANSMRTFKVVDELQNKAVLQYQKEEENLQQKRNEAITEIRKLQSERTDRNRMTLSPEQQAKLANLRKQEQETSRALRTLRRDLRVGIENLGKRVKVINILLVPLCVGLAGITRISLRKRR